MQNFKKIWMPVKLLLVQNWGKMAHSPQPTTGTSFGISYIPLLSVMTTLHCHRIYQISSLQANLSLEDMKPRCTDCRQKPASHSYTYPKTNN